MQKFVITTLCFFIIVTLNLKACDEAKINRKIKFLLKKTGQYPTLATLVEDLKKDNIHRSTIINYVIALKNDPSRAATLGILMHPYSYAGCKEYCDLCPEIASPYIWDDRLFRPYSVQEYINLQKNWVRNTNYTIKKMLEIGMDQNSCLAIKLQTLQTKSKDLREIAAQDDKAFFKNQGKIIISEESKN